MFWSKSWSYFPLYLVQTRKVENYIFHSYNVKTIYFEPMLFYALIWTLDL
jgi:hypothetical protein